MIIEFAFIIYKKKWINHICIISVQAGLLCLSPYWARVHRCHIHHICNHNFYSSGREQGMPYSAFSATLDLFYTYGSQSNKRNNAMIRQMKYTIWSLSAKFHVFKLSWHHDIMSSCHHVITSSRHHVITSSHHHVICHHVISSRHHASFSQSFGNFCNLLATVWNFLQLSASFGILSNFCQLLVSL